MSVPVYQKKFKKGEITPLLYGDTSQPWYGDALRLCKNWIPISQGPLVTRPGTKFIADTPGDAVVKTKGFLFPDGRSYVFEFSNLLLRVIRNGALVGAPYTLATPWTTAMLPFLKFAQVGNTVTITYGGQAAGDAGISPRDLIHSANTDSPWQLIVTPLAPLVVTYTLAPSIKFSNSQQSSAVDWPAWSGAGGVIYVIGDRVRQANQSWISIQNANNGSLPASGSLFWTLANDVSHPGVAAEWRLTTVVQDNVTGQVFETSTFATLSMNDPLSADRPARLQFVVGSSAAYRILFSRLYRGTNGVFGWLTDLVGAPFNATYTDFGVAPDFTQQPPQATDPFLVGVTDNFPAVVSHYEQRRMFFRSSVLPQTFWGSRINNIYSWDRFTPGSDADSILFTIVSEVLEEIRAFAPMRVGIIMSGLGEWTLRGSQGAAISRSNVDLKRQSAWGSSWRDPIIIGNGLIYNTAKSNMVRDFFPLYGLYTDIWDGDDLSWQARHFMEGHTIVDWAYQSVPYSIIWMVRDDGVLLSMTYVRPSRGSISDNATPIVAWAQHSTGVGDGFVENVAVVPEPPEDAVYLVVRRVINGATVRYHERMNNLIPPTDFRNALALDAASTYDGHISGTTIQFSGGTYQAGAQALVVSSNPIFNPIDIGTGAVVIDPDVVQPNGTLGVSARILAMVPFDLFHATVEFDGNLTQDQINRFVATAGSTWAVARSVFTVNQLTNYPVDSFQVNGARGLAALVDGNVTSGIIVAGATVTLPIPGVVVAIGISYNCDAQLLDAYLPNAEIRNRFKTVLKVGFNVATSRGLWAGKDFDNLFEWQQRQVSDSYGTILPGTGYFENEVSDDWNKAATAAVRQWEPLPVSLLGVLREMEIGGT